MKAMLSGAGFHTIASRYTRLIGLSVDYAKATKWWR